MSHAYKRIWRGAAVLGILLASLSTKGAAQWSAVAPPLSDARVASHSAVVNGKLYMWDGTKGTNPLSFTLADITQAGRSLDLNGGTSWTTIANLPVVLIGGVAEAINGKIYVTGGVSVSGQNLVLNAKVYIYDPATNAFSTATAAMPNPQPGSASFVLNNKLFVVGGYTGNNISQAVQSYDPATNTWEQYNPLPNYGGHMAAAVVGNDVYLIGGYSVSNQSLVYTAAVYKGTLNGQAFTWTQVTNFPMPVSKASAGVLDGKIYVTGGEAVVNNQVVASPWTFVYDPSASGWASSYAMPIGTYHSGPLRNNGNSLYLVSGAKNPSVYKFTLGTPKPVAVVMPTEIVLTAEKGNSADAQVMVVNNGVIDLTGNFTIPAEAQSWLSLDQSDVTISAGGGIQATFMANTTDLAPNMYKAVVNFTSNDASNATIPVTIRLFVADKLPMQETNVLVEEATGTWCGWCPYGHEVLADMKAQYNDDIVVLTYHGGSNDEPMRTTEGQNLFTKLGGSGYPSAGIQRWLFQGQSTRMLDRGAWENAVSAVFENQPQAPTALELMSYNFDATSRKVTARVKITTNQAIPLPTGSTVRLTAVLSEDSLQYTQHKYITDETGQAVDETDLTPYYHNDVVRMMTPNANGAEITIGSEGIMEGYAIPGKSYTKDIEFTVPTNVKQNNAHVVFIVSRLDNNTLGDALQAMERPLIGTISQTASFAVNVDADTKSITVNDTAKFQTTISNTGNVAVTVTPSRTVNSLPDANWKSWFCLSGNGNSCTTPDDNDGDPVTIQPGSSATIVVKVFGASEGQGKVTLRFGSGDDQLTQQYTVNATNGSSSVDEYVVTGSTLRLSQNVPNPASTVTRFTYNLASAGAMTAEVFTLTGEKVMTVANGHMGAGEHTLDVNVANLANGVYTVRLTANNSSVTRMMTVAR